jgi:hypothetical protein
MIEDKNNPEIVQQVSAVRASLDNLKLLNVLWKRSNLIFYFLDPQMTYS